jgi:hypothetical protein
MLSPYARAHMHVLNGLAGRARDTLAIACMPRARRSRRLRATLAAVPVLLAHALGPCMEKMCGISGTL